MNAQPAVSKAPNLFELSGDGIHVTYSASSFDGQPRFSYQDANQSKQFSGDQIRAEKTVIGTLVSVTIFQTIDAGSTTFTVLIPTVNLRASDSANITTYGVTTLHKFSIIGAPQGQTEFYAAHALGGVALWVVF
jgi:hypothetical protein